MGAGEPGCTFCEIVAGTRAAQVVLDGPDVVAFLDHRPLFPGHVLVVPRVHLVTLLDLPVDAVGPYFAAVQRLTAAVTAATGSPGSFVALNNVVSQSVAHLHTHVVPRRPKDGLRGFFWPRGRYGSELEAAEVSSRIRAALAGIGDAV